MDIQFDNNICRAVPGFEVLLVEADVVNPPTPDTLWAEIDNACANIRDKYAIEDIRHRPAIDATRTLTKPAEKSQTATDRVPKPFAVEP